MSVIILDNFSTHSSSELHKTPVSPSLIAFWKAPTLLAIVTTLTSDASVHLFSDLAVLNNVSHKGARLISTDATNSGNLVQSTKGLTMILSLYVSNSLGKSSSPTMER